MRIYEIIKKLVFGNGGERGLVMGLGVAVLEMRRRRFSVQGYGARPVPAMFWKRIRRPYALRPSAEPNPHVVISGMSGFGKSALFKSMLIDVAGAGASCVILDAHDEHEGIVRGLGGTVHDSAEAGINILALDGATVNERIAELGRVFRRVYRLGYIQSTKLGECLWYTYRKCGARTGNDRSLDRDPRMGDLLYEIGVFIRNARGASERNTLLHLRDKMSHLNIAALSNGSAAAASLDRGTHSFSLSGIRSEEARVIYIEELLVRIYSRMKLDPKNAGIRQYIMLDEAQFLTGSSERSSGIVTKFIEEGRKYGRGVVIVTHASSSLNRQIVTNAATFISFYAREPSELAFASKLIAQDPESEYAVRQRIARLGRDEAVIVSANDRNPKVVSTKRLAERVAQHIKERCGVSVAGLAKKPVLLGSLSESAHMDREKILGLVKDGAMDYYAFSAEEGGEEWVMEKRPNISAEHEVMVAKIYGALREQGVGCYIFDRAGGPDIVAYGGGRRIAIEYETGRKSVEESMGMFGSRAGYSGIIVIVNDLARAAYEAVAGDGLLVLPASRYREVCELVKKAQ